MSYATVEDVQRRFVRDLEDQEEIVVAARLDDVENIILSRIPDLEEKVASGKIRESVVVMIEAEAVLRLIRNPDGYSQETDGNYSYSISSQVASGRLSITDDEWRMLGIRHGVAMVAPTIVLPGRYGRCNPNADFESGLPWGSGGGSDGDDTAVWA